MELSFNIIMWMIIVASAIIILIELENILVVGISFVYKIIAGIFKKS